MGRKLERNPEPPPKKRYETPAMVLSEKAMAQGVTCSGSDPYSCGPGGPITSI